MGSPCGPLSPDIALTTKPVRLELRSLEQKILGQLANLAVVSILETAALEVSIPCEAEMQGRAATIFTLAAAEALIIFTTS
jgi:hypothetical protein